MPSDETPGDKNANAQLLTALLHSMKRALVAAQVDLDLAKPQIESAQNAVQQIVQRIGRQDAADLLAPGFASHGFDHPLALSDRFCELLEGDLISLRGYPEPQRIDIVMWSILAFVFHDLGMLIFPEEVVSRAAQGNYSLEDAWASDAVRSGHDRRSLEFIEDKLYLSVDTLPAWCEYWASRLGAQESGSYELLVLARICQSHGDNDGWLDMCSLDSYSTNLEEGPQHVEFPRAFGEEYWNMLKPTVFAATTILNLVDLLDVRGDRIHFPKQDLPWSASLPASPEARQQRFLHWLGNKYCTLRVKEGAIEVETHPPVGTDEMSVLREVLLDSAGPVADLLKYGRSPQMSQALAQCFGVQELKVRVRRGRSLNWQAAEREALRMPPGTWPFDDRAPGGSDLSRNTFDTRVTRPLWFRLSYKSLGDGPSTDLRLGPTFSAAFDTRLQGLALEDAYEIDTDSLPDAIAYAIKVSSPSNYRTDSFFAGLRLARWVASRHPTNASSETVRVYVAAPTSWVFAQLTQGTWVPDGPAVILVLLDRSDPADVSKMIRSLDNTQTKLIFACSRPELLSEVGTAANVAVVDARYLEDVAGCFSKLVESLDYSEEARTFSLRMFETPIDEALQLEEPGVGYLVRQWLTARDESLYGLIKFNLLDESDRSKAAHAQGALVLLHMAEARRFGVDEESTRQDVYNAFTAARRIPGVAVAISPLPDIAERFPFNQHAKAFDPWAPSASHKARLDAMELHRGALCESALSMLLFDALTMIAVGQAFNPQHVDWNKLDRVIYPALKAGVKSMQVGATGLQIGGEVAIPLAANAADALGAHGRWHLARTVGEWGPSVASDEGLVCFQAVYRLLRPVVKDGAVSISEGGGPRALGLAYVAEDQESGTFLLGCLEAVCSGTVTPDPASLDRGQAVVREVSSRITQGTLPEIDVRMGFDVLYTYRVLKSRSGLVEDSNPLWRLGVDAGWLEQSRDVRAEIPGAADPEFAELRARFDRLQECTPARFKRELSPGRKVRDAESVG